jgi:hypothetical protein
MVKKRITRAGTRATQQRTSKQGNYITIIKRNLFLMVGVVNVDLVIIAIMCASACTLTINKTPFTAPYDSVSAFPIVVVDYYC